MASSIDAFRASGTWVSRIASPRSIPRKSAPEIRSPAAWESPPSAALASPCMKLTAPAVFRSSRRKRAIAGAKTFKENAHFHVGSLAIKTLFTFGHSPGMTTYFVTGLSWPLAVVGDSIFASSMGGSPTHFADQYRNNRDKILTLPRDTVLACGHGPLSTLAQEKQHNPFFAR